LTAKRAKLQSLSLSQSPVERSSKTNDAKAGVDVDDAAAAAADCAAFAWVWF